MDDKIVSVLPKPGFSIRNRNQGPISVSVVISFSKTKTFFNFKKFHIFLIFSISWKDILFYKLENKPRFSKNNLKIFQIWQQVWFYGTYYKGKNTPHYRKIISILVTRSSLSNVVSVLVTVLDQSTVGKFVFWFRYRT